MFANIKQTYKNIEDQLECSQIINFGLFSSEELPGQTFSNRNFKALMNRSLLLRAAAKGDTEKINVMLANGMSVNARKSVTSYFVQGLGKVFTAYRTTAYEPSYSLIPLHFASINGHCLTVELLINYGANINAKDDNGLTPLHLSSGGGYTEVVELLSDSGANVNAKDRNGVTPLHLAAEEGHLNVVQFLIAKKASPNAKTKSFTFKDQTCTDSFTGHAIGIRTPLHLAIKNSHLDVMKVLLPIVVNIKGDYIDTLHIANDEIFLEAVKLLVSMDENVMPSGVNIYQKLFDLAIDKRCLEAFKILVRKEVDVNIKYEDNRTPLHKAVEYGTRLSNNAMLYLDIIKVLLQSGADINLTNCYGLTPLDYTVFAAKLLDNFRPMIQDRKYADNVIDLFLEKGCNRDTILRSINFARDGNPVMIESLKLIVRYYLINQPGEEKPVYFGNSRDREIVYLSNYWDECIAELAKMKEIRFSYDLKLYDVFISKNLNTVASYAKNKEIIKYCESNVLKGSYPIYKDLILKKLSHGKIREELLDKLNNMTINKGDVALNSDCQRNIVKYLSNDDLYNLSKAAVTLA